MTNSKSSRKIIQSTTGDLLDSVNYGVDSVTGYWQARAYLDRKDGGDLNVPFHDFLENNTKAGKKNLLTASNCSKPITVGEMSDIFKSTLITQQKAIPNGFFMYSALLVNQYFTQCEVARHFNCSMHVEDIYKHFPQDPAEFLPYCEKLEVAHIATEFAARCFYEGAGSLGGYKDRVWLLWGRLKGVGCPDNDTMLSDKDARTAAKAYGESNARERKMMFVSWFNEAYGSEYKESLNSFSAGGDLFLKAISLFWEAYEMISFYKMYEAGKDGINDDDSAEDIIFKVKAICAGIFRRSSKGITESSFTDYTKANHLAGFVNDEFLNNLLISLLSDGNGETAFSSWLQNAATLANMRIDMYFDAKDEFDVAQQNNTFAYNPTKFRTVQ